MEFKSSLKKFRTKNNLTQDELGEKIGISGKVVSKWESGNTIPDVKKIQALCEVFDCEYADLIGPEKNKKRKVKEQEEKKEAVELNINKDDSKILKVISKILYIFAKISKIGLYIGIVFIILGMIVIPSIVSRIEVNNNSITYRDLNGNILSITGEDISLKGNYVIKYKDQVIDDKIDLNILKMVNDTFNNVSKTTIIIGIEAFFVLCIISTIILIIMVYNIESLLKNIHDKETPFTKENIQHLATSSCLMIALWFCNLVMQFALNEYFEGSSSISFDSVKISYILVMFMLVYIFKYGYNMQQVTNGKIYAEKED